MAYRFGVLSGQRLVPVTSTQWAPTLTAHEPNPPLPLETPTTGNVTSVGSSPQGPDTCVAFVSVPDRAALNFNALADRLTTTQAPVNTSAFTWCGWAKWNNFTNDPSDIFEMDWSGVGGTVGVNNGGTELLSYNQFGPPTAPGVMVAGVWYFIALKISGTSCTIYKGDETTSVGTGTNGAITAPSALVQTGIPVQQFTARFPNADLSRFRIWDALLSDAEVEAERTSMAGPARTANLSAEWRFNNATTPGLDSSGNGRNLSPVGGGSWTLADGPNPVTNVTSSGAATAAPDTASGAVALQLDLNGTATAAGDTSSGSVTVGSSGITCSGSPAQASQTGSGALALALATSGTPAQASQTGAGAVSLTLATSGATSQDSQTGSGAVALRLALAGAGTQVAQTASGAVGLALTTTGAPTQAAQTSSGSIAVGAGAITMSGAATQGAQSSTAALGLELVLSGAPSQAAQVGAGVVVTGVGVDVWSVTYNRTTVRLADTSTRAQLDAQGTGIRSDTQQSTTRPAFSGTTAAFPEE